MAEEVRRVGTERQLRRGDHLGGVPVVGEVGRGDLQVQLHAGAGRFRRNGFRVDAEPFGAGDVDEDVLAASGEDGVVERLIPHRRAHPAARQVLGHERGQDADHDDVRAVGARLDLRRVEAGAHFALQFQRGPSGQRTRRDVEFDVVGAQFGLVRRIGDGGQDFRLDIAG